MCLQPAQKKAGFTVLRAQFAQPAQKRPDLPCFERIVYTKPRQGRIYRALNTLCAASPEKIGFTVLRTHCLQPAQKRPDSPCFAHIVWSQRRKGRIYRASNSLCAASADKAGFTVLRAHCAQPAEKRLCKLGRSVRAGYVMCCARGA